MHLCDSNPQLKLEHQSLRYKRDTQHKILYYVNKFQVIFFVYTLNGERKFQV